MMLLMGGNSMLSFFPYSFPSLRGTLDGYLSVGPMGIISWSVLQAGPVTIAIQSHQQSTPRFLPTETGFHQSQTKKFEHLKACSSLFVFPQ